MQNTTRNVEIPLLAIIITRNSRTIFVKGYSPSRWLQLSKTAHILHFPATRPFENSIHHNAIPPFSRYASLPDPPLTTMGSNVARHAAAILLPSPGRKNEESYLRFARGNVSRGGAGKIVDTKRRRKLLNGSRPLYSTRVAERERPRHRASWRNHFPEESELPFRPSPLWAGFGPREGRW